MRGYGSRRSTALRESHNLWRSCAAWRCNNMRVTTITPKKRSDGADGTTRLERIAATRPLLGLLGGTFSATCSSGCCDHTARSCVVIVAEANADDEMNSLISKATKETAAVTNTNLNQIAKLLPSKLLGGDFVQIDSQINMG